ncbi:MAG: DUF948 domain-containing protein [Candidatus Methylomirabilales bacterium]
MSQAIAIAIAVAVALIAIAVAATAFALFPLIRQARQLLNRVDSLVQSMEGDVRLTLSDLRDAVHNVNQISAGIHKNMDKVSGTVDALAGLSETLRDTSDIIRTSFHPRLLSFGAMLVGLKTGSWYLLRKVFMKRR